MSDRNDLRALLNSATRVYEWMREPDWDDEFCFGDWANSRPCYDALSVKNALASGRLIAADDQDKGRSYTDDDYRRLHAQLVDTQRQLVEAHAKIEKGLLRENEIEADLKAEFDRAEAAEAKLTALTTPEAAGQVSDEAVEAFCAVYLNDWLAFVRDNQDSDIGRHAVDFTRSRVRAALEVALPYCLPAGRWQPIETAPKDGTEFVALQDGDIYKCSNEHLSALLRDHVGKGDPVDVSNLAMMIHQRGERIAAIPTEAAGRVTDEPRLSTENIGKNVSGNRQVSSGSGERSGNEHAPTSRVGVPDEVVEAFGRQMYGISWTRLSANHERRAEVRAALETALLHMPAGRVVPDGWVLVPEDPSEEMLSAGEDARIEHTDVYLDGSEVTHGDMLRHVFAAMLEAAPSEKGGR